VAAAPGSLVRWQAVPPTNGDVNLTWGPTLTDITQHTPLRDKRDWGDFGGTGHELTHAISFELRLVASRSSPARSVNGFYVLGGQAALMKEPQGFKKSQVAGLVPPSLRQSRFGDYMSGQIGWDAQPLYVWDEWNAYINGATVAVERYQIGLAPHTTFATTDTVFAVLEFTIYALAVIHAAQQYEPAYLTREPQAREFFAYNARRAMALVKRGRDLPPFKWSKLNLLEATLRSAPEAEPLRASARSVFGPGWAREVFGF